MAVSHVISILDTHTEGEPTRVVLDGGPPLGGGSMADQLAEFRDRHDRFRSAMVNEPRGSDVLVGALLRPPTSPGSSAGVLFFNNVGYLGMCGHGTIGVVAALAHLGRVSPGRILLDTCVGTVAATLGVNGLVSIENVPSYRTATGVAVDVPGLGRVTGDVAWGGNWFYLLEDHGQSIRLDNTRQLTEAAVRIRQAINASGFPEVDHIELFGPPTRPDAHSQSFVLCPGHAYDRSPCGTGTSAKLACLAAAGKLNAGETWVQESVLGTSFSARFDWVDRAAGTIRPTITGRAYVTAESRLLIDADDPFAWGVPASVT